MLAKRASPTTPLGAREHAMLLLGFGAALRRSELVGLALGDVECVPDKGLLLTIGRSKTDQHGAGQRVAVWGNPKESGFCPAAALDAWLAHRRTAADLDWTASAASRAARPLFCAITKAGKVTGTKLSDNAVARLLKQAAADARLDAEKFSGHSLRRRLLTAGSDNHAQLAARAAADSTGQSQPYIGALELAARFRPAAATGVFERHRVFGIQHAATEAPNCTLSTA